MRKKDGGGNTDIILSGWAIECKKLGRPSWSDICKAVAQAETNADSMADIAVAVVSKKNQPYKKCMVIMSWEQFIVIQRIVNSLDASEAATQLLLDRVGSSEQRQHDGLDPE